MTSIQSIARLAITGSARLPRAVREFLSESQVEQLTDQADAAARADAIAKMHDNLLGMFVRAMEGAGAPSTPKLPIVVSFNIAEPGERDRFRHIVRIEPVTFVAHELLGSKGATDDVLRLYIASNEDALTVRALHIAAMGREYAEAYAAQLVDLQWSAA